MFKWFIFLWGEDGTHTKSQDKMTMKTNAKDAHVIIMCYDIGVKIWVIKKRKSFVDIHQQIGACGHDLFYLP